MWTCGTILKLPVEPYYPSTQIQDPNLCMNPPPEHVLSVEEMQSEEIVILLLFIGI